MVTVLYFASVRDRVGLGEEVVDPPADVATAGALADWLALRSEGHARAFADRSRLRVAVDLVMGDFRTLIVGAREVAYFPPVTGG